jgi:ribosomal protein L7/L12
MGRAHHRPDETPIPPEVQELVQQGKAKEAVKRYRELTGSSLQQAQAAIDSQM